MSHGRRMLEAQAQKGRATPTQDDGRVDDGHLRIVSRALNDDGTPVRPSRGSARHSSGNGADLKTTATERDVEEEGGHTPNARSSTRSRSRVHDTLLTSPPPRVSVQLGRERRTFRNAPTAQTVGGSGRKDATRRPQRSGHGDAARRIDPGPAATSLSDDDEGEDNVPPHREALDQPDRSLSRGHQQQQQQQPTPTSLGKGDNEEEEEGGPSQAKRSRSASASRGVTPRYPAARVQLSAVTTRHSAPAVAPEKDSSASITAARAEAPLTLSSSPPSFSSTAAASLPVDVTVSRSRTASPSPPPVTRAMSALARVRVSSPPCPVTAALRPPASAPDAPHSTSGMRPTPLQQPIVTLTAPPTASVTAAGAATATMPLPAVVLLSPASPPLRAGVSPRMLPRHPARFDAAAAAASAAASANASPSNTVTSSPSSSQPPAQPFSQPSPDDALRQQQMQMHWPWPRKQQQRQQRQRQRTPEPTPPTTAASERLPSPSHLHTAASSPAGSVVVEKDSSHSIPPSPLPPTHRRDPTLPPPLSPPSLSNGAFSATPPPPQSLLPPAALSRSPLPAVHPTPCPAARPAARSGSATHHSEMPDLSGFHNAGNDCYGCSALTMLLRSTVFRRALLSSPLVVALRRYIACLTGKPEKAPQWGSGYVAAASEQAAKARKRRRVEGEEGEEGEEATVAEVCGVRTAPPLVEAEGIGTHSSGKEAPPPSSQQQQRRHEGRFVASPPPAVQATLDALQTFTEAELEEVIAYNYDTEHIPLSLHSALAGLVRQERLREVTTTLLNSSATSPVERRRLMRDKVWNENDRLYAGEVYAMGIRLTTIASLFHGEFFLGEQEDAHELFVALMAKLETEAVDCQKRCAAVLLNRAAGAPTAAEARPQSPPTPLTAGSSDSLCITGITTASPPPLLSTAMADVWVNALVQTRLLNIIRCRSPGCHHEIVTDEICVNLSLHIPEEEEEEGKAEEEGADAEEEEGDHHQHQQQQSGEEREDEGSFTPLSYFPMVMAPTAVASPPPKSTAAPSTPPPPCSVTHLLHHSMAFEPLSDYRCDACGSTSAQYQGGCFYSRPPPVLVLQLKRFSTDFVQGSLVIRKNGRRVAVEDTLVVTALPSTEELRQHEGLPLRSVAADGPTASSSCTTAAITAAATQERRFFYDAENKCFTCVAQVCASASAATPPLEPVVAPSEPPDKKDKKEEMGLVERGDDKDKEPPVPPPTQHRPVAVCVAALRCVYRLQSCVLHLGQSLHYGHYVSDFAVEGEASTSADTDDSDRDGQSSSSSEEGEEVEGNDAGGRFSEHPSSSTAHLARRLRWRRANDARVEVLRRAAVASRRAGRSDMYLLLYEKVEEEWVRCPVDAVLPKPVYPAEQKR